ncbi:MAG: glycosyl hydrolase [Deltaproteobacteria bacterium]|nr:glycosyl hydrolase [Deltaproteobacteria bacterium]
MDAAGRRAVSSALVIATTVAGACPACNDGLIDPGRDTVIVRDVGDAEVGGDVEPGAGCPVTLRFVGAPQATSVAVAGSWNGFSTTAQPMVRDGDAWVAELRLPPGEHAWKAAVNGVVEGALPAGTPSHWEGGVENRNLVVSDCARGELVVSGLTVTDGRVAARVCFAPGRDGAALASLDVTLDGQPVGGAPDASGCVDVDAPLAAERGKHRLEARARDAADRPANDDPLWIPLWREPFDWRDATLYMAMPDRFRDSDGIATPVVGPEPIANWQGGDLAGLTQAIEESWFGALGVDALWLTPVLEQPDGAFVGLDGVHLYAAYHGYWPIAVDRIDPRFGGDEALRALVASAHARGIKIVMDVVLNHVHEQHPYCDEGLCRTTCVCGTTGCDWEARARDCQFATYLPDLDYRDHATVVRVADDLVTFVRDHDLDGLRVDAVKHVDHAIVQALRARLDRVEAAGGAPFWLVGETFTGSDGRGQLTPWIGPTELDGQFDFPLYWTMRDTFAGGRSFRALEAALVASEQSYGAALPWMSPFLGNHDVPRMATAIAGNDLGPFGGTVDRMAASGATPTEWDIINRQSMAFAFLLTLRGVPLVYMGDELGLGGSNDPDNRRLLPGGQADLTSNQAELLRRVRELGVARRGHAALRRGQRREIWIDDTLYVQARWLDASEVPAGEPRVAIVALNKGAGARSEPVTLPPELGVGQGRFESVLSSRVMTIEDQGVRLELDPWEYALFVLR